jgi:SAM-dependent methyltransferase
MKIHRVRSLKDYEKYRRRTEDGRSRHDHFLETALAAADGEFTIPGFSYPAGRTVNFKVEGAPPNWRESVLCPVTKMNNRMRATVHLFDVEMAAFPDSLVYFSEQTTPVYRWFAKRQGNLIGSEYLGDSVPRGASNVDGIRNEDLCALTFEDSTLDCIVSLDVFEHIPDYLRAFVECARVLKSGGRMMWSVPFNGAHEHTVRATIGPDGQIQHHMEPEYHGDPISNEGVLCFRTFGWRMLDQMRAVGFREAYAIPYQSQEFGYLGPENLMFFAIR